MPAEWEPHEATWIAWPHNRTDWPGKYEPIPFVYAEIVRHLARVEKVHVLVNDKTWEDKARAVLTRCHVGLENVTFHRWPTNRVWTRDYGPTFVKNTDNETVAVNWRFNAWAKYEDWKRDDAISLRISRCLNFPVLQPSFTGRRQPVILEGGSIDVNGCGTLLTTEECLLSRDVQVRNPGASREELESVFAQYLGTTKVIWLKRGIAGDDTHGHIDDIARFVAPDMVVAAVESNPEDANYEPLRENLLQLKSETDQNGRPLRVVELPMPSPVWFRGQRLPASYANFYIASGLVLVPTFNDPNDRIALNTLTELFPHCAVSGIYCGDLIWGLGAIHCMTQQQPA
ncbi:MAG: agmatine/peptidylarginine deiminase [Terriglobales bacterium]